MRNLQIYDETESFFLTSAEINTINSWISEMKLHPLSTPKEKMRLAERTLQLPYEIIGNGWNRMVYDLGNGYVLKIALSEVGLVGNNQEYKIYFNSTKDIRQYLCPVIEKGQGWIIMKKMVRFAPINLLNLQQLIRLSMQFILRGIIPVDLRLANVALTDDNQMVVVDYGFFITLS